MPTRLRPRQQPPDSRLLWLVCVLAAITFVLAIIRYGERMNHPLQLFWPSDGIRGGNLQHDSGR